MSLSELERRRSGEFRRWVVVSTVAHLGVFAFFGVSPRPAAGRVTLPAVVEVRMVELPGAPPAAALPEPEPEPPPPEPPKPKPKPKPEKVVLPEKPEARPEPPKPKPKPAPKPEPEPGYEDLLASLREERGETAPRPTQVADAAPGAGRSVGGDVLISPEEAAWRRRVKVHVHRSWVMAQGFRLQPLETHVRVRVAADGTVLDLELIRRSGNPWYDESVERALKKASPLPTPPDAGRWDFVFRPEDAL